MTPELAELRRLLVRTLEAIDCVQPNPNNNSGYYANYPLPQPENPYIGKFFIYDGETTREVSKEYHDGWLAGGNWRVKAEPEKAKPQEDRKTMKLQQVAPMFWIQTDGWQYMKHAQVDVEVLP